MFDLFRIGGAEENKYLSDLFCHCCVLNSWKSILTDVI